MGLRAACPIARAVMDHWIKLVNEVAEKSQALAKINPVMFEAFTPLMMAKYVDDVVKLLEAMRLGVRWSHQHSTFIWTAEAYKED